MTPSADSPALAKEPPPTSPVVAGCWSQVLQKQAPVKPEEPISSRIFGACTSTKGISVAVVDANAIIHGDKLLDRADKFVTVAEALDEVRDPVSRQRMSVLPIHVETMEPSPSAINKVVKFARETGDFQTLSDVDLKIIALAYMLECQIHGASHLRDHPPPLKTVSVKKLPEADMPGWGSNVPNLAEWEALEHVSERVGCNETSRILPLKDLNYSNDVPSNMAVSTSEQEHGGDSFPERRVRYNCPKKEVRLEGKMVIDGVDASQEDTGDQPDEWMPAVSRSTKRRFLRRKARREMSEASEKDSRHHSETGLDASFAGSNGLLSDGRLEAIDTVIKPEITINSAKDDAYEVQGNTGYCDISSKFSKLGLKSDSSVTSNCIINEHNDSTVESGDATMVLDLDNVAEDQMDLQSDESHDFDVASHEEASENTPLFDDISSEHSWSIRSLSESTVACVTSDFAMQNVILQLGLRLLAPGGMQIRQLRRWVLRCHACNKVVAETGRLFCPQCGNGGTLRKVSVTVGENGVVLAARRPRINLRGTKFSLPLPQGGRDAITKNPILREDQLPRKVLYPKSKKNNKQDDFFTVDDIFSHSSGKKSPLKPPVGRAIALYSGRRNPNDNHFSRRRL